MRTSCAIKPRKGSIVRRRIDASTPRLCNSSTTRERHCRPNPLRARYQPPPINAESATTISSLSALTRSRREKGDCRSCGRATAFGSLRMAGITESYRATDKYRFTQIFQSEAARLLSSVFYLCQSVTMRISDLPAINASLNLISTVFISAGWFWIRRNLWKRHVPCMIAAVISSTLFLTGYIVYHVHVGEKSSGYRGWLAAIYFPMLASHVLLAFVTLPLVILTLIPVFRRRWDRHRRIGRWTMPIWLYVSVTGVLVYLMLYKWFPPPSVALGR